MKTKWILPHGLNLRVQSVIDMNTSQGQNNMIVHIILSNMDTDGPDGIENKEKLTEIINKRTEFYKIQNGLRAHDLKIQPNIQQLFSKGELGLGLLDYYFKE